MKIAIPVTSDAKDTAVSDIFGRTAMFMIYDTETDASIYIRERGRSQLGAASGRPRRLLTTKRAFCSLPQLRNAAKVLAVSGIKLYKTQPGLSAQENLERFKQGELETLTRFTKGSTGTEGERQNHCGISAEKAAPAKTFIAVNLVVAPPPPTSIVTREEPNGHLFKPAIKTQVVVNVPVPRADPAKCIECRLCVDFCAFHALAWTGGEPFSCSTHATSRRVRDAVPGPGPEGNRACHR